MLPELDLPAIAQECLPTTPTRVVEAIAEHRAIAMEALAKIQAEGTVVRTLKGDVIAHPAIKIHADAVKQETALLHEWGAKKKDRPALPALGTPRHG